MDAILVMDAGVLTEYGTHDLLYGKQGLYYTLYQTQKELYLHENE